MPLEPNRLEELRIQRPVEEPSRSRFLLFALAFLGLAVAGYAGWRLYSQRPITVRTAVVRELPSTSSGQRVLLNASGYVVARREATVSSKVTGKVVEVLIEEGMKVSAGQVLARLDDANVRTALRLAEAQADSTRSVLAETKVRLREAERELVRVGQLRKTLIATEADMDRADAEVESLKARIERQQAEITVMDRQVAVYEQQLDDTIVRAPFGGVATSKNAQPGEMISPISAGGGFTRTGIGTIVDMSSLEIEVDVNESFINRVQSGQPVEATLDAYPDWKIACKVIAIIPTADRQKATVKVRVGFELLDPRILPQMGVKVAFQGVEGRSEAVAARELLIPRAAIRNEEGRDVILVIAGDRVERRAISVGAVRGEEVFVTGGISAGDRVVLQPSSTIANGSRVREGIP